MDFIEVNTADNRVSINVHNISHYHAGSHGKAVIFMINGAEIETVETVKKVDQEIEIAAKIAR